MAELPAQIHRRDNPCVPYPKRPRLHLLVPANDLILLLAPHPLAVPS